LENHVNVEYEFGISEARAYAAYFVGHDPTVRKQINKARLKYLFGLVAVGLGTVLYIVNGGTTFSFVFGAAAAFLLAIYLAFPYIVRRKARDRMVKQFEKTRRGCTRKQELSITGKGLNVKGPSSEATFKWHTIENVVAAEEHLFIKVQGYGAVVVPRAAFDDEIGFQQFFGSLKTEVGWIKRTPKSE